MPKLKTLNCSLYTFQLMYVKNCQFLSRNKRDAHKRKSVPFFCLTMYINLCHTIITP